MGQTRSSRTPLSFGGVGSECGGEVPAPLRIVAAGQAAAHETEHRRGARRRHGLGDLGWGDLGCIDIQIRVDRLDSDTIVPALSRIGYRLRGEPWNTGETSFGVTSPKLVFAPPVGARRANVHVRVFGSANARFALLFRDYLRANPTARQAWVDFKRRLAQEVTDLYSYGQIKQPAMMVLMEAARCWATTTAWTTPDPVT